MKRSTMKPAMGAVLLTGIASAALAANFGDDVAFMKRHTEIVTLRDRSGRAQVAVAPAYQGRVMTSTAGGDGGTSFGWINRELIASGVRQEHINVFGGEDRFWLGPEGGQFSIFFAKGASFDLDRWQTPAPIDTEGFAIVKQTATRVHCRHRFAVTNFSGTVFSVEADRVIQLIDPLRELARHAVKLSAGVSAIGFESRSTIRNVGPAAWRRETGLLSIWILGMLNASPATTVVIPFRPGPASELGPAVNDAYFGKVPSDRLVVRDGVLFFKADAQYRSKIGLGPKRAMPALGSYDPAGPTLTLVRFSLPKAPQEYVNSMWELQKEPFSGDVVNSYNDGPSQPGAAQMGKFYELESSSPAVALSSGRSASHTHQTIHLQGPPAELEPIARAVLGVDLKTITGAFSR